MRGGLSAKCVCALGVLVRSAKLCCTVHGHVVLAGDGLTGALVRIAYGQTLPGEGGNPTPQYWMMQVSVAFNSYTCGTWSHKACVQEFAFAALD